MTGPLTPMTGPVAPMPISSALRRPRLSGRRRRFAIIGALSGFLVLVLAACYLVFWSPVFAITAVEVTGTEVLKADEVRTAADVPLGSSLVLADVTGAVTRIAGLSPVAEVTVTRQWPAILRIEVTERQPRLSIAWNRKYLVADATGVVFQVVSKAPDGLIPVSADPANRSLIADTGTVFSALNPELQKRVEQIQASTRDSITIKLKSGPRVVWGDVSDSALKSQVLDALIDRKASVIDVSAPATPTTR